MDDDIVKRPPAVVLHSAAFKRCTLLWALEHRGLQWKEQGKIAFTVMHLTASTEAWCCSCWCLAVAFGRGVSGASVLFLFGWKNIARGSVGSGMLKMTAAIRLWCRERAVTSASPLVGWGWGVAGTGSVCARHRSVFKLGPSKWYSTDALSCCSAFKGRIPEGLESPVESCHLPLRWSRYLLSLRAREAEAQMLN